MTIQHRQIGLPGFPGQIKSTGASLLDSDIWAGQETAGGENSSFQSTLQALKEFLGHARTQANLIYPETELLYPSSRTLTNSDRGKLISNVGLVDNIAYTTPNPAISGYPFYFHHASDSLTLSIVPAGSTRIKLSSGVGKTLTIRSSGLLVMAWLNTFWEILYSSSIYEIEP